MNIIGDIVQSFNNVFEIAQNETQDDISYNDQVALALGAEQVTAVPLQQWYAPFSQIYDYRKDNSYNTLSYLNSLGYRTAIWELSEYHPKVDVCDTLNGRQFTLDQLLLNAQHYPPSPIFTLSHPDCFCFLKCFPPNSAEEIPDTAPGLPISRMDEKARHTMKAYKNKLYKNMFEVYIDSFTMLPPKDNSIAYSSIDKQEQIVKYGFKATSIKYPQPVKLNATLQAYLPLYLRQPVRENMLGFQIIIRDNFSVVYLNDYNRLFLLPTKSLNKFQFNSGKELESSELKKGDFCVINESLSIVRWNNSKSINVYVPLKNMSKTLSHTTAIKLFQ